MFINDEFYSTRSEIVTGEECPRLQLLGNDLDGTGYELKARSVPLLSGIHIHNALARALGHFSGYRPLPDADPVQAILDTMHHEYEADLLRAGIRHLEDADVQFTLGEQMFMLEGMLRGWIAYRLPHILESYDVVSIEDEFLWELCAGVRIPIRLDALLRRKDDGLLYIMDYKGCAAMSDDWQQQHEHSKQTILYLEAVAEHYADERVGGIFYEGLVRGKWAKDRAANSPFFDRRIQQSPYCYGYMYPAGDLPLIQVKYTAKKGYVKFRVCDQMPMQQWITEHLIPERVLPELFCTMEAVNPPPEVRTRLRQQAALAEQTRVSDLRALEHLRTTHGLDHPLTQQHLNLAFPQRTGRCTKFGEDYHCAFKAAGCFAPDGALETLATDDAFQPRVPHHDIAGILTFADRN